MKIVYVCLKNFASIYTAMKKRKIEIDLSRAKNRVILLVGRNGTGKTSLLSTFHPFAYPGNMDVRNNDELILDGEDGYKEIHILDDGVLYIIKHHYMYSKNGRTTKSYIAKDGVELNPNGNVNSFKEVIQMELSLELDYLKLIRLGSNVTNFIDMKATDRKNFTSDLLSDIDIYTQFYKKINEDSRILKTVLKSVADKIDKLKILDEKDIENTIHVLEIDLDNLKRDRDDNNSIIWKLDGSINAVVPEGVDEFFSTLGEEEFEYKELSKSINNKESKLDSFDIIIMGDIDETINGLVSEISRNEGLINTNNAMVNFYFSQLENFYTQKEDKENSMKYITSDLEYSKLTELLLELNREKEKLDKHYKNYEPKCTKEDMLSALRLMQEIDTFISNIYTFNHDAAVETIDRVLANDNIEEIVKREVLSIDDKMSKHNLELLKLGNTIGTKDGIYVLYKPTDCGTENCPYMRFYQDHTDKQDAPTEKINSEIKKLEKKREYMITLTDINKNIDYILLLLKTNKVLIDKMPEDFFGVKHILSCIKDCIPFFDEDVITNYISALEDYERYVEIKQKLKDVKKEITFIEKNATSLTSMQKELQVIDNEISKAQAEIDKLKKQNEKLTKRNENLLDAKETYESYKVLQNEISLKREQADNLLKSITNKKEIESKIKESIVIKKHHQGLIDKINIQIKKVEDEINDNKFKLKEFQTLNSERAELEDKYDEISILKEALSSNKGIPLLFIQLYLKNTKIIVNNLLETVFKGTLEIEDFEINDKEFRIPYTKNGIRISDVIYTSQGEKSFMSLALSFALIEQSIKRYNVMLLDEIDATLDQRNRAMFLNILEKQLEAINAEQVFMITHNNMFDNYPVDVIMTSEEEVDNYKNMNVLYVA